MVQQPSLFPPETPASSQAPSSDTGGGQSANRGPSDPPHREHSWLMLLELAVRVIVQLYVGLVLAVLPWTHFWTNNHFLYMVPNLNHIALSGAARGVITGLGLLNLWIAASDAVHFNEP